MWRGASTGQDLSDVLELLKQGTIEEGLQLEGMTSGGHEHTGLEGDKLLEIGESALEVLEHTGSVNEELIKTGGLALIVVVGPLSGCPLSTGIPLSGVSTGSGRLSKHTEGEGDTLIETRGITWEILAVDTG